MDATYVQERNLDTHWCPIFLRGLYYIRDENNADETILLLQEGTGKAP